MKTNLLITQ